MFRIHRPANQREGDRHCTDASCAVERKPGRLDLMAYYPGEYNRLCRTVRRMHKPSRETVSVTFS